MAPANRPFLPIRQLLPPGIACSRVTSLYCSSLLSVSAHSLIPRAPPMKKLVALIAFLSIASPVYATTTPILQVTGAPVEAGTQGIIHTECWN